MSIVILGDLFTFPEGNAATNRVYSYAKGFIENGINTYVICFHNEYIDDLNGSIDGIRYYHPFMQTKRSNYFIVRRWYKLLKYFNTIKIIKEINKADRILAINCYSRIFLTRIFAYFLAKLCKTKILLESSEHPLQYNIKSFFGRVQINIELYIGLNLFDGILCISRYLVDFYKNRGIKQQKLFIVPSTVDSTRFIGIRNSPLTFKYILYCGDLSVMKDGVDYLIKSFAIIAGKYLDLSLVLIGKGKSDNIEEKELRDLVKVLKIENRVFFLGQISRNEIPSYLMNAEILALARPKSLVADAGFPSKLTEYLATGKPVVVTEVGDIPDYLKNNETAFLAKPNSAESFADKLEYVLQNYSFSLEIGKNGKELTKTIFNYNFQAKRVIEFVKSL